MAEYPGAARAGVSPNRSDRQGKVRLFIVHHYAGTQDPESAWNRFMSSNDRDVSPNYQVNADGSVFEVVPPDRYRAWTTGAIDHQAVTCETQNTSGAPNWGISRESHEAIARLVAWAAARYGFPIQRGAVADGDVVTVPGVVGHRETPAGRKTGTACPGPSMDLDWIVNRAREIAGGSPATTPPNQEDEMTQSIKVNHPQFGSHLFAVGDEFIGHYSDSTQADITRQVTSATDELHSLSPEQTLALLDGLGIPRAVLIIDKDGARVLNPQSGQHERGGVWSRRREAVALGEKNLAAIVNLSKSLADKLATPQS